MNREKAKKKYSIWQDILYCIDKIRLIGKRYYLYFIIDILLQIAIPFLLVLLPGLIVGFFQNHMPLHKLLFKMFCIIVILLIGNMIKTWLHQKIIVMVELLVNGYFSKMINQKLLCCDIDQLEGSENAATIHEVQDALHAYNGMGEYGGFSAMYLYGEAIIINIGGFLLYSMLVSNLQFWLFLVLFITSAINCYAKIKAADKRFYVMQKFWNNASRFWQLKNDSIDLKKAKDIRMYHLHPWFEKMFHKNTQEATRYYDQGNMYDLYARIIVRFTTLLRDGCAYYFLITQLIKGSMPISQFLIYIGVVAGFANWMQEIIDSYTRMKQENYTISLYRSYHEGEEDEAKKDDTHKCEGKAIAFDQICFGYQDHLIFDHFSLDIHENEKIALVGVNGAGKTTLMKLLCGLYPLRDGQIKIDGTDITNLTDDHCRSLFSVVFQDIDVLPFSIAKNISCAWSDEDLKQSKQVYQDKQISQLFDDYVATTHNDSDYDEARIIDVLKKVNLWDKVSSLPDGIHSVLTHVLDKDGILLSGGETQKLLLARALYKDAPILILDEPTSALDPIAESELYEDYAKMCDHKISIFISHRLSSTRFCDRILFLENGVIKESGTHDELMNMNGAYANMYRIQSHYYQKEVDMDEAII